MNALEIFKRNRSPFSLFGELERDVEQMFNFAPMMKRKNEGENFYYPASDVIEKDKEYLLEIDLPGMDKKDVKVEIKNGLLSISGERKSEKKENGYEERSYGKFL